MSSSSQKEIVAWFDKTYKSRGQLYLRPANAYKVFANIIDAKPGYKYLDVACGMGRMFDVTHNAELEAYGVDISSVAINYCKEKFPDVQLMVANAESLPFKDGQFDRITCIGSLERIINLELALTEIHRVAKENASICLMVRNSHSITWTLFKRMLKLKNVKGHQGAKNLIEWSHIFKSTGFKIIQILPDPWPKYRLMKLLSFGMIKIDYSKPRSSILPFRYANEYIFLLKPLKD